MELWSVKLLALTLVVLAAPESGHCLMDFSLNSSDLQHQIDTLTNARYLLFPHIYRSFIDAGRNPNKYNISNNCQLDLTHYYWALNEQRAWAWRLYDATGKQGSGLFLGALTWKGNFHECLNTLNYQPQGSFLTPDNDKPQPQYCSVFLATPHWLRDSIKSLNLPFPVPMPPFTADVCVPASCSQTDLGEIVQTFVNNNSWGNMSFTVTGTSCFHEPNILSDPAALWTMALLLVLLGCVTCGTSYDIYLRRRKIRVKRGPEFQIGYKKDTKQYGILKVILAPPSKTRMGRRNTIGGYEKSDSYQLDEIKVDRVNLVRGTKASSNPDVSTNARRDDVKDVIQFPKGSGSIKAADSGIVSPEAQQGAWKSEEDEKLTENQKRSQPNGRLLGSAGGENWPQESNDSEVTSPLLSDGTVSETSESEQTSRRLSFSELVRLYQSTRYPDNATCREELDVFSMGSRSSFDARMPRSAQTPIKHTPAFLSQGSVYERELSVVSEDDSLFEDKLRPAHHLYDIPEESPQEEHSKKNGLFLQPEIVVRDRPIAKAAGLLQSILLSFSFRRSTKRIMAEGSPDTLFCLNGVRVLSISWIVLGNVYMLLYLNPEVVDNHVDGVKLTQKLWVQVVINTTLAADSFYILSGTLAAYSFMKLKKNFQGKKLFQIMTLKEYFKLIFHRLVRIGPCYWLVLLFFTNLMPYMGQGPRWSYEITSVQTCKEKWWANAFFFSNFYEADSMCMPHTYYLVNDFQFALLSPLFLIPLLCMPKVGFLLLGGVVAVQILSTLILNQGINGNVLRMQETDYFSTVYVKPYCRMGVYAIGLGLGYILFMTKRQSKFRKIPRCVFWALSLLVVVILPHITYLENRADGRKWTGIETAVYEALSRPLWGLALAWIIYACSTQQGAFIGKLLSWNAFLPLCRITYGVYLLHPMLIAVVIGSRHNGIYIHFTELTYEFVANLTMSYLVSFFLITFVECPFATLEGNVRAHLGQRKWKK